MKNRNAFLTIAGVVIAGGLTFSEVMSGQQATSFTPSGRRAEAAAGFDGQTNGFVSQADHEVNMGVFNEHETPEDGLGPLYNADGCGACHFNPVVGGVSEISELRIGHMNDRGLFVEPPGGSLINSNALAGVPLPYVPDKEEIHAFRMTLGLLGDGFIEAIADEVLEGVARSQPNRSGGRIAGQVIRVPILEAPGVTRVGRFGWKNQHASLVSFSADAYVNEMGITTPFFPNERTSLGVDVSSFNLGSSPNDSDDEDIQIFARFMRATKVPPRDLVAAATVQAQWGEMLFDQLGCDICHMPTLVTAPAGTSLNGGTFVVPEALGNKTIHPYSDFLLHDVGTGDGIVQNGDRWTANKLRTPPLWGLRTRNRLMHDGLSLTYEEAVLRHKGEAQGTAQMYQRLSNQQQRALYAFLRSL